MFRRHNFHYDAVAGQHGGVGDEGTKDSTEERRRFDGPPPGSVYDYSTMTRQKAEKKHDGVGYIVSGYIHFHNDETKSAEMWSNRLKKHGASLRDKPGYYTWMT